MQIFPTPLYPGEQTQDPFMQIAFSRHKTTEQGSATVNMK